MVSRLKRRVASLAVAVVAGSGCGDSPANPGVGPPEFDENGTWQATAALPETLRGAAATLWMGSIYVIGGYADAAGGQPSRHVLRVDPATLQVEALNDLPVPVAAAAAVVYRDTLLLVGGNEGDQVNLHPREEIWWYDRDNDAWPPWGTMPDRRLLLTAQVVADRLIAAGGEDFSRPPGDSIIVFEGRVGAYGEPPNRDFFNPVSGGVIGDTLFFSGGSFDNALMRYVATSAEWLEPIPMLVSAGSGTILNGRYHVVSGTPTAAHQIWNDRSATWLTAPPPPTPVRSAPMVTSGGRLFLLGGTNLGRLGVDLIQVYTPPAS